MATVAVSDLERKLVDVGDKLSTPPSDVEELLSLLNLAKSILSKVKQNPSDSTCGAIHPVMKSLVAEDLMNHTNIDVKVALASCFMEITRISAPTDPYDDNLMKAIYWITIDALVDIDDLSSRSHGKRVSILETITGVESFFMLLDLECNDLILEMFHHFLKAARKINDGIVITFMENMMTKLLNESEDVLLSRLLDCVVKDVKDGLPIHNILAEKVIGNCAEKLRPYLIKLAKSSDISSNNYGDIITAICQHSDTSERNKQSTTAECLALESSCRIQGLVDERRHQYPETNSKPKHQLPETNLEFERAENEVDGREITRKSSRIRTAKKFFDEETSKNKKQRRNSKKNDPAAKNILKEFERAENDVDGQAIARKSSRIRTAKKFFDGETYENKKQRGNSKKNDIAAKHILKKCGEASTSKSAGKTTKLETPIIQKSTSEIGVLGKTTKLESLIFQKSISEIGVLIIEDDLAGEHNPKDFHVENHRKELDGALVGKRIKVWWPIDEKFYEGVISAFDPVSKKHTVRYADGDKEKVWLKDEHWIDLEEATQSEFV